MSKLLDFLEMRPFFTFFGLRVVWYIYLLHMLLQLYVSYTQLSIILTQRGIGWQTWLPNSLPLLVTTIAQIALVRVLLEVAAAVLLKDRQRQL